MSSLSSKRVVLASSNKGKLAELKLLLAPLGLELCLQSEFDVSDAEETGLSFIENAILKARHASAITGLPALADDSGLEVDALDGKPGIYSARFASMNNAGAGDSDNNQLLLQRLQGISPKQRTARFRCVLALMKHQHDPSPLIAEGAWEGTILDAPAGEGGFGYDPLFYAPDHGCSAAQLAPETKAQSGHRGRAMAQLKQTLSQSAFLQFDVGDDIGAGSDSVGCRQ